MSRRARLTRIDPLSAAKMYGALLAVIGLIIGTFISLFAVLGATFAEEANGVMALLLGAGAIVVAPMFYGVLGFVVGGIQAWVYNVFAVRVGGIGIELTDDDAA